MTSGKRMCPASPIKLAFRRTKLTEDKHLLEDRLTASVYRLTYECYNNIVVT